MADASDPRPPDADVVVPIEDDDEPASDAPRRAASAQFVVESSVGTEAMLRDAMDPANRSLADALRLSYRVLQGVMLILLVLFVFSGVQKVQEQQSGVLLRWGKIVEIDGREALEPGPHFSIWPYPIGEFVLIDVRSRVSTVGNTFWPSLGRKTFEEAVQQATVHDRLNPGRDGSILTIGGDMAHVKLDAMYEIDEPALYLKTLADDSDRGLGGDRLVSLVLRRAAVHAAAKKTLEDFVEMDDGEKADLRRAAQEVLNVTEAGIRITQVNTPVDPTPALAIKKAYGDLQQARVAADSQISQARQDAHNALVSIAGMGYPRIVGLVDEYERAALSGDAVGAEAIRQRINTALGDPRTSGDVAAILGRAKSHRSQIEATLGNEALRFESHLTNYREQPQLFVDRLWSRKRAEILQRSDTEVIVVPAGAGTLRIALTGIEDVRVKRREALLNQKEGAAMMDAFGLDDPYIQHAYQMSEEGKAGRQLDRSGNAKSGAK